MDMCFLYWLSEEVTYEVVLSNNYIYILLLSSFGQILVLKTNI